MKKIQTFLLLLFSLNAFAQQAQNITGVWKGEFYVDSTKMYYPFEMTISEEKGKYTGSDYLTGKLFSWFSDLMT